MQEFLRLGTAYAGLLAVTMDADHHRNWSEVNTEINNFSIAPCRWLPIIAEEVGRVEREELESMLHGSLVTNRLFTLASRLKKAMNEYTNEIKTETQEMSKLLSLLTSIPAELIMSETHEALNSLALVDGIPAEMIECDYLNHISDLIQFIYAADSKWVPPYTCEQFGIDKWQQVVAFVEEEQKKAENDRVEGWLPQIGTAIMQRILCEIPSTVRPHARGRRVDAEIYLSKITVPEDTKAAFGCPIDVKELADKYPERAYYLPSKIREFYRILYS